MQRISTSTNIATTRRRIGWLRGWLLAGATLVLAVALNAASVQAQEASPVYRFYNTQKGLHFFTISAEERDDVLRRYPWFTYEGVAFYGYTTQAQPDTQAVYRFFNTSTGAHFYTMSASERDFIVATYTVFVYEGPVYFASPGDGNGRAALYRFYNTRTNAHFFTTSSAERDYVILTWPWFVYEETAYYVYTSATPAANAVPPPVVVTTSSADVWRLLNQATFGASQSEAARVQALGIPGWIEDQFTQPVSGYPDLKYNRIQLRQTPDCTTRDPSGATYPASSPQAMCVRDHLTLAMVQRDFFTNAVSAPDQLRQRVAWALSQVIVTSGVEAELAYAHVMSRFQSILFAEAFGNFETLLKKVTLSPAMGNYLDMVNNDKPNGMGRVPNENYAREIMQLFSIGLDELNIDGTPVLDASGNPVPTYDQTEVVEFSRVFTGYTYADPANPAANATRKNLSYYAAPMVPYPIGATTGHDTNAKTLLSGVILPANQMIQQDIDAAVRNVFLHPNTGPFIGKQLIQRLVTGNPSPAYVARVAGVFNNNGAGVRGDLKAVVRAILLDPEARGGPKSDPTFGSLREPVLMLTGMIRAIGGVTDGARLADAAATLGQRPYFSPTVFNYFSPDQTIPGTAILAPEFGIHTTNTAVGRTNLVYTLVYSGYAPDSTIVSSTGTRLNLQQFESLADNPAAMVTRIADVLTAGQVPAAAQALVVTAVNAIAMGAATEQQWKTDRARMGVYLIGSSYHYQVQR